MGHVESKAPSGGSRLNSYRMRKTKKGGGKEGLERSDSYRWILYDVADLAGVLDTNLEDGHTEAHAARILKLNGPNVLPGGGTKRKKVQFFFRQFAEITHLVLFAMGIIHLLLDMIVGGCLLIMLSAINFCVTYMQEIGFESLMKKLRSSTATQALVIREGVTKKMESKNLVIGDVVILQTGDTTPADIRIIDCSELKCSEAAFTGESVDVKKTSMRLTEECKSLQDRRNMAFMSTSIVSGHGRGVVVSTGKDTQLAKISQKLAAVNDKIFTNTDKLLLKMYAFFLFLSVATALLIIAISRFDLTASVTAFAMSAVLSALPSGLRTVLLILLTSSSRRLLRHNVVLKRLQILEQSGYVKLLFCDKTGTITVATMTAVIIWSPGSGYVATTGRGIAPEGSLYRVNDSSNLREYITDSSQSDPLQTIKGFDELSENERHIILISSLCNNSFIEPVGPRKAAGSPSWKGFGSPTELSLCVLAHKIGAPKYTLETMGWKVLKELPFDCEKKIMSVLARSPDGSYYFLTKGAPERLLDYLRMSGHEDEAADIYSHIVVMTEMTLRVLAFSYKKVTEEFAHTVISDTNLPDEILYSDMVFAGTVGIHDPLRPGVPQTISELREAGVSVKLITGDSRGTAIEIAKESGILSPNLSQKDTDRLVCSGMDILELSDEELASREIPSVIYRCTPELKLRVVTNMKYPGYKSIVVGDGLNDAASIKAADVGISMGIVSTNVTRAAADVILVNDDFTRIIQFLKEGRGVCWRLKYFLMYYWITLISSLLCCLISINNRAVNTGNWVLIITNSTIMLSYLVSSLGSAWFFDPCLPAEIMKIPPNSCKAWIFSPEVIVDIIVLSLTQTACSIAPFFVVYYTGQYVNFVDPCEGKPPTGNCIKLYRARTASFLTFTFLMLVVAVHCRSIRMPEWGLRGIKRTTKNWIILVSSLVLLVFCCCMSYIKSAAEIVLYQTSITWETALVPVFIAANILIVEFYKYAKRRLLGPLPDELSIVRQL